MLLEEVRRRIDLFEFQFAKDELYKIIQSNSEEKKEAYKLLLKILKNENSSSLLNQEIEFVEFLFQEKDFIEIYKILSKKEKELTASYKLSHYYLEALWILGRVDNFVTFAKNLNQSLLERKRYNNYLQYIEYIELKYKNKYFTRLGQLYYFTEINDVKNIIETCNEIKSLVLSEKEQGLGKSQKLIKSTYSILTEYTEKNAEVYYLKLYYKLLNSIFNKSKISQKECIEYLMLTKNGYDLLPLLELELEEGIKLMIKNFIKTKETIILSKIPKSFKKSQELFKSNMTISTVMKSQNDDKEEQVDLKLESNPVVEKIISDELSKPKISAQEKEIIVELEHEELDSEKCYKLALNYISLDMFYVAEKLVMKMKHSSNKFYLLAEIKLNLNECSEVIYICNTAIDDFKIQNEDQIPFLYLKARSYEKQNNYVMAQATYRDICVYDPDFMDSKGRIK